MNLRENNIELFYISEETLQDTLLRMLLVLLLLFSELLGRTDIVKPVLDNIFYIVKPVLANIF